MYYKGYIFGSITPVKNAGVDTKEKQRFKLIGFKWYQKKYKIGIYLLVNEAGEIIKECKKMFFMRSRDNEFYLM